MTAPGGGGRPTRSEPIKQTPQKIKCAWCRWEIKRFVRKRGGPTAHQALRQHVLNLHEDAFMALLDKAGAQIIPARLNYP